MSEREPTDKDVLTTREMQELFGDALEAKMELVSVGDRMYRREGRVWRRLDGERDGS